MIAYLDASVLVPLIVEDLFSTRAIDLLTRNAPSLVVSDFAAAEFASVIGRRVRMSELTHAEALESFGTLDTWLARTAARVEMASGDIAVANTLLRRLDLGLRAPDAINIAIGQRCNAALATFDAKMATVAEQLGIDVLH